MNKYEVTWLFGDGKTMKEEIEAETYGVEANGLAVFIVFPKIDTVAFVPNPQNQPQQRPEIVGTVGGYNLIKRIS